MESTREREHLTARLLASVYVGLPIVSLLAMAVSWLRYGLDLPYRDDWREYISGQIASLDFAHLFRSDNDTMSVTTRVLDALAQRHLDGNAIAYQLITMLAVLAPLLLLQWKLLNKVLHDRILASCAFCATLLMLQPDSYWGQQNLAYIQAVPALCLLAALYVILFARWKDTARCITAFMIGLLAGFTYISGAISATAVGGVLLAASMFHRSFRATTLRPSAAFSIAALISLAAQAWVILSVQGGKTHRSDAAWALPNEPDFWLYLLGKIGRSLMLPDSSPLASLVLSGVLAASVAIIVLAMWRSETGRPETPASDARIPSHHRGSLLVLCLVAAVSSYLLIVAAGRTNLRPDHIQDIAVFQFGYKRFHFFWVTLLWPWLIAGLILVTRRWIPRIQHKALWLGLAALVSAHAIHQGAMAHRAYFKQVTQHRTSTDLACLQYSLMQSSEIRCPTMAPYGDLVEGYRYAVRHGASFTRHSGPTLMYGNPNIPPLASLLATDKPQVSIRNASIESYSGGILSLSAGRDVQLHFQAGHRARLKTCLALRVTANIHVEQPDTAQLFYQDDSGRRYSEQKSQSIPLAGNKNNIVSFVIRNDDGFRDALRLDPARKRQASKISNLEITCLL